MPSKECYCTEHEIKHDDIIVMGSDGLWDNVFDEEIIQLLE
jgi:serine/threonine protein phosphatase PrpC